MQWPFYYRPKLHDSDLITQKEGIIMIYFNNAGTSWPKPASVNESMAHFTTLNPDQWLEIYEDGLETVCRFFNIQDKDRFLFTTSCTSSLSVAFSDFPWDEGDRLITSTMEHHALSRWFHKVQRERMVEGVVIPRASNGPFDLQVLETELQKGAKMVAVSMASNVTGELLPYREIINLCKNYNVFCLLDAAQTAGILPIDINDLQPDFFVFAGHKGPLGPQGIGGLYISKKVAMACPTAACEITPGDSAKGVFPSYCDTGSVNMMALKALTQGIKWLESRGWDILLNHRYQLVSKLRKGLSEISGLSIAGIGTEMDTTGAVSITTNKYNTTELADILWKQYKVKVSAGFQCAPMAHEALQTDTYGTVRFSVGPETTENEVDFLLKSMSEIVE